MLLKNSSLLSKLSINIFLLGDRRTRSEVWGNAGLLHQVHAHFLRRYSTTAQGKYNTWNIFPHFSFFCRKKLYKNYFNQEFVWIFQPSISILFKGIFFCQNNSRPLKYHNKNQEPHQARRERGAKGLSGPAMHRAHAQCPNSQTGSY